MLSSLLDGLGEDLNRVVEKPYTELADSNDRPDEEVAREWWRDHVNRELSIITALFTGQFKSLITCEECCYRSARFEPFVCLSLPFPAAPNRCVMVTVCYIDPKVKPIRYAVHIDVTGTLQEVKESLVKLNVKVNEGTWLFAQVVDKIWIKPIVDATDLTAINAFILYQGDASTGGENSIGKSGERTTRGNNGLGEASTGVENSIGKLRESTNNGLGEDSTGGGESSIGKFGESTNNALGEASTGGENSIGNLGESTTRGNNELGEDSTGDEKSLIRENSIGKLGNHGLGEASTGGEEEYLRLGVNGIIGGEDARERENCWNEDLKEGDHPTRGADTGGETSSLDTKELFRGKRVLYQDPRASNITPAVVLSHDTTSCSIMLTFSGSNGTQRLTKSVPLAHILPQLITTSTLTVWQRQSSVAVGFPFLISISPELHTSNYLYKTIATRLGLRAPYHFALLHTATQGGLCPFCPWIKACKGCTIEESSEPLSVVGFSDACTICIEWEIVEEVVLGSKEVEVVLDDSVEAHLERVKNKIELVSLLENFTAPEQVDGVYCGRCQAMRPQLKQIQVWRAPPILILHLKRFEHTAYRHSKLQHLVTYPLVGFDLAPFLVESGDGGTGEVEDGEFVDSDFIGLKAYGGKKHGGFSRKYDLYGVIEHSGGVGAGHYVAIVKHEGDDNWYCFDDEKVFKIDQDKVVSKNAYLLFYIRQDIKRTKALENIFPCNPVQQQELETRVKQPNGINSDKCSIN